MSKQLFFTLSTPTFHTNRFNCSWKFFFSFLLSLSLLFASQAHSQESSDTRKVRVSKDGMKVRNVKAKPPRTQVKAFHSNERITIKFSETSDIRIRRGKLKSRSGANLDNLKTVLAKHNISARQIKRLFSRSENELDQLKSRGEARSKRQLANLNLYYVLSVRENADIAQICDDLNSLDIIESAEPEPTPAPQPAVDSSDTPDFSSFQGYKNAAPYGIGADDNPVPGVRGDGIQVVDIEYDWVLDHEDLQLPASAILGDATINDPFPKDEGNHGTAVLGMLVGRDNGYGVTGIVPNATAFVSPSNTHEYGFSVARAITVAMAALNPGDVILLEMQMPVCGGGEHDNGPIEWYGPTFDAISAATANGIVVVEAAGNGNMDLDSAECNDLFDRDFRDSGAIIVGAGYASSGAKYHYSTYGSRVDVHGWGGSVATTGYGYKYDTGNLLQRYTTSFNGTSSASPIVTGAAIAVQASLRAAGAPLLTSEEMRELLTDTGTPKSGSDLIGPLPDIQTALLTFDRDGDDLLDALEAKLGTNPDKYDSDGDGVSDYDELNRDGDPINYTPGVDTDPLVNPVLGIPSQTKLLWPNGSDPVASDAQEDHPAINVGDNSISTRWSAQYEGQTITFDLGESYELSAIKIAFLKGNERNTYFDIAYSANGSSYTTALQNMESNGESTDLENFNLSGTARYVRIIGQGNSSNNWNSLTEVQIWGSSSEDETADQLSANTMNTFAAEQTTQTLNINANVNWTLSSNSSWISVSSNSGSNNGSTFITVDENTNTSDRQGSITLSGGSITQTIIVNQEGKVISDSDPKKLSISNTSSTGDDGNAIGNTQDNRLDTRWSVKGDGQYATFDLGSVKFVSALNIAFYKGDERNSYFSIAVSDNGSDFTTILANETSSGNSLSLEEFVISSPARYVRVIGHGNSSNTWNSLTELEIWGTDL